MKTLLNKTSYGILYSGMRSSVETWKLECNIEIGGHIKKNEKNEKMVKK